MTTSIHLQGVGRVTAIPAHELQVGMKLMWNGGSSYEVVSIAPKGQQSLTVVERGADGKEWTRTLRKERLVAGYWPRTKA